MGSRARRGTRRSCCRSTRRRRGRGDLPLGQALTDPRVAGFGERAAAYVDLVDALSGG
jgi:hypothetical protein